MANQKPQPAANQPTDPTVTDAEVEAFINTESHITGFPGAGEVNDDYRQRIRVCLAAAKRAAAQQTGPDSPDN